MITCFFLIIKPESFDAKAHKSVFPVKKKIYFHNRVDTNTLNTSEFCVYTRCVETPILYETWTVNESSPSNKVLTFSHDVESDSFSL